MRKKIKAINDALVYFILSIGAVSMVVPFLWMVSTSLKEKKSVTMYPPQWIPDPVVWANYPKAISVFPFFQYLWNTFKITSIVVLGDLLSSALAGYAFARMR
ncbi:MAG: carbohydrate ABC transporter permease, partial [Treponema sp.]|nr:carbohydrate ABC transporter permease [Treponema sp.]